MLHRSASTTPVLERAVFLLGAAIIALAAVYRGSNRWLPLTVLEWLSLGLLLALLWLLLSPETEGFLTAELPTRSVQATWALVLVVTSPFWISGFQLVPVYLPMLETIPGRMGYDSTDPALTWGPISLLPDETMRSALAGLPVMASFALALTVRSHTVGWLMYLWLGTAACQALLGLLQLAVPGIAFADGNSTSAQGSFGSKNSMANYLAMLLPIAFLLATASSQRARRSASGGQWAVWSCRGVLLLLLAGLFASKSRAGIAAGVLVLLLAMAMLAPAPSRGSDQNDGSAWMKWGPRFLPFGLLLFAMASGGWDWLLRFESGDPLRMLNWSGSWQALLAFWPLGSGLATFGAVFPRFQPPELGRWFVNFAHNDYLQLLVECGVLVVPVLLALIWLIGRRVVQLAGAGHRGALSGTDTLALACGLGFLAQALHAWVDYPWRIPATAMLGAFLLGVFLREPEGRPHQGHGA